MPNPTPSDLHVQTALTNISVAYLQDQQNYITTRVFPLVSVEKQADRYFKYTKGDWFRTDAQRRAPSTESVGSDWSVTTDSYFADVWAVHKDIDDQLRANADTSFNLDRDATLFTTNQLALRRDKQWMLKYFNTGIWDTLWTGVAAAPGAGQFLQFNAAGSDPVLTVTNARFDMMEKTGYMPNVLVVGPRVWQYIINHQLILDRIKYTQTGIITRELVAAAMGLERVEIMWATENTANEGAAATMSYMASKSMLLVYSNPTPSLLQPSAGYTFGWQGYMGASRDGIRIKRFRMEEIASDRIEGEMAFDTKVVSTDLGVFFATAVA